MADSNLAETINFRIVRETFPEIAHNKSEINRVYRKANKYLDRGFELKEALKIGRQKRNRRNDPVNGSNRGSYRGRNQPDIFTEPSSLDTEIYSEALLPSINEEPSFEVAEPSSENREPETQIEQDHIDSYGSELHGTSSNQLKEPMEPGSNKTEPMEPKPKEPDSATICSREEKSKVDESWFQQCILFIGKLFGGWADIAINLIASPALVLNLIFIGCFTGILIYLQKDFYILEEGRSEIVAFIISGLSEIGLVLLSFIRLEDKINWIKNILLGVLFLYVGCCLGFTVLQNTTNEISNVQASIFSQEELDRLKTSVLNSENAQKKVKSRDGATAIENARKSVEIAQNRLDNYVQTHPKISKSVQNLKEVNALFQGVLLVFLRLIFMGVNAVLAHNLRNTWDRRTLKLA